MDSGCSSRLSSTQGSCISDARDVVLHVYGCYTSIVQLTGAGVLRCMAPACQCPSGALTPALRGCAGGGCEQVPVPGPAWGRRHRLGRLLRRLRAVPRDFRAAWRRRTHPQVSPAPLPTRGDRTVPPCGQERWLAGRLRRRLWIISTSRRQPQLCCKPSYAACP